MEVAFALIIGLVIGSFLNVVIVRLPHGVSITTPRSRCPQCQQLIAWHDNIPVLSYLILGARCRRCHQKISARYPLIEALSGVVSVLLYFKFGISVEWGIFFVFSAALIVLAFIDLDHRILPDIITLNGIWAGVVANVYLAQPNPFMTRLFRTAGLAGANSLLIPLAASLLGALIGGGLLWGVAEVYLRLRGIEGMGLGDVKMMAMVGAFLGAPHALLTIMLGSLVGSVIGLLFIRLADKTREYELPFGTFLSFAGIVAVLYGDAMLRWYIQTFMPPGI